MGESIEELESTTFARKRFTRNQLRKIQETVKTFPNLSRKELVQTICEHLRWTTPRGTYRIQPCLNALEEMEKQGIIKLPALLQKGKLTKPKIEWTNQTKEQSKILGSLKELLPISIELVREKEEVSLWNEFVDRYHYLKYKRPMGNHLRYFIVSGKGGGEKLGCLLFSASVQSLVCRDEWIGWNGKARAKNLNFILNNNRFLIFPWVEVKNLASKVLSLASDKVVEDCEKHYCCRPILFETFVDPTKYEGTCYKAANWQLIGKSEGRICKKNPEKNIEPKDYYIYPLDPSYKSILKDEKSPSQLSKKSSFKIYKNKNEIQSNDPFIQIFQKIIEHVTVIANEFDQKWQKRKRAINTMLIILFIFRLVFSKNKQGYGLTIQELWAQLRMMEIPLPQYKPVAASAFCNARSKLDENIFKVLNHRIITTYETTNQGYEWNGHKIFAVDGSKMSLPLQLRSEGYKPPSKAVYYPQGLVSCLYQLKSKIPYEFEIVNHSDERKVALSHIQILSQGDIVIYDRGYYSYAMLYYHIKQGIHAVFRIQSKTHKLIDEFTASDDTDELIEIDMSTKNKNRILLKYPEIKFIPIKLRLIKYTISGTTYTLATTLVDQDKYKAEEFSDLYHARWGIEELYKISKRLIDVEEFHSHSNRGIRQELFAHFVLITINRIFANYAEDKFISNEEVSNSNSENLDNPSKFKVNFKNCLITIARNMEGLFLETMKLATKRIKNVIRSISICRQKERKNRSYKRFSMIPERKWRTSKKRKKAQAMA